MVKAPVQTTNYLINSKRDHILTIESRYQIKIELHAEVNLISPHYLIENAFNEKRVKKKIDKNRQRSKKKDNESKKEIHDVAHDQKISANAISEIQTGDEEPQKKRKKNRKRKYQKDLDAPTQPEKKPESQQDPLPSTDNGKSTNKTDNNKIGKEEIDCAEQKVKKEMQQMFLIIINGMLNH